MKISRYIKFPLIFSIVFGIYFGILSSQWNLAGWFLSTVFAVLCGFGLQFYSDYKVRQIKPDATEQDFEVKQNRTFIIFYDYEKAFDLCLESLNFVERAAVKFTEPANGVIRAKTGINWRTFGANIDFKISKLTDHSSQIEVSASPFIPTTLISYGDEIKIISQISDFFERKNDEKNLGLLVEKRENTIDEIYSRQKEAVKVEI